MQPHHLAWLNSHPERSPEWLQQMLLSGFEVHHIDADHLNNDPVNLVLIERVDHMRLHGIHHLKIIEGHMQRIGKLSGKARLIKMSKRKRSAVARNAANARWRKPRVVEAEHGSRLKPVKASATHQPKSGKPTDHAASAIEPASLAPPIENVMYIPRIPQ